MLYQLRQMPSISTYPCKGTETSFLHLNTADELHFNLSPQGDGNGLAVCSPYSPATFQLIPARGRKLLLHKVQHNCTSISTYPRKGTKNSASKKMRSFSFANLNSLFSVGYSSMNRAAAAFSLPWLLYCDKMCYNRANSKHLLQNTQTHFLFIVQFFHNL